MRINRWWTSFLILLLAPAAHGLPVDVDLDHELLAPVLPDTGVQLQLDTGHGLPRGAAEVCAVGTCIATDGNRDLTRVDSNQNLDYRATSSQSSKEASERASSGLEAMAVGASAAALVGIAAKWWLVGPGRIMTFLAGPLNMLFWGATSRLRLTPDLENPTRARILQFIAQNPGASIQEVRRKMDVAWGTAVYHLQHLERSSQAVSCRDGNRHRYWIAGTPEAGVRTAWMLLEQPTVRRIARAVGSNPGIHQGGICERLQMGSPTASKHLKRLVSRGLVEANRCSRYMLYSPTARLTQAMSLWDTHHDAVGKPPSRP